MEKLLRLWNEEAKSAEFIKRDKIPLYRNGKVNVVSGIRRCGKTHFMFQLIQEFNKNVFYIDLEDERIIKPDIKFLNKLWEIIEENAEEGELRVFIDEIQNVKGWEKFARRVAKRKDVLLFVSGSSSELTPKNIARTLRGRTLTNYLYPLNFREFLRFKGFDEEFSTAKRKCRRLIKEFLRFGGFPEIVLEEDTIAKIRILQEYFSTIIERDIIEMQNVDNITAMELLIKFVANNASRLMSFSAVKKWINSVGVKVGKATLIEYFSKIENAFFAFRNPIFSYSIKDVLQYPAKVYVADNGFISALTLDLKENIGWLLENLIAIELKKMQDADPMLKIHYWKSKDNEVDFVVRRGVEVGKLMQVCAVREIDEIPKREIKALIRCSEELKCNKMEIITLEAEGSIRKNIKVIPLADFLLNKCCQ